MEVAGIKTDKGAQLIACCGKFGFQHNHGPHLSLDFFSIVAGERSFPEHINASWSLDSMLLRLLIFVLASVGLRGSWLSRRHQRYVCAILQAKRWWRSMAYTSSKTRRTTSLTTLWVARGVAYLHHVPVKFAVMKTRSSLGILSGGINRVKTTYPYVAVRKANRAWRISNR
ncbi:hypothetical protein SELMODRAFT_409112 [Selaginella moellendorffii]|uniref:Uncharacterized protein n=1 Tax=Selaginella moellendorffii TaxID=88036 RepID=D8RAE4_SELML|nr:hypothetical protein SELMODRAFT_409112 [Selaginella moellendorffii]